MKTLPTKYQEIEKHVYMHDSVFILPTQQWKWVFFFFGFCLVYIYVY